MSLPAGMIIWRQPMVPTHREFDCLIGLPPILEMFRAKQANKPELRCAQSTEQPNRACQTASSATNVFTHHSRCGRSSKESDAFSATLDEMIVSEKAKAESAVMFRFRGRVPELDGLRGIAILTVLIFHYIGSIGAPNHAWWGVVTTSTRLFWSGVDLFFVLSGFLISGILLDSRDSASYYRTFYMRRLHRILPVYCIWLALFFGGVLAGLDHWLGVKIFDSEVPLWFYPLFIQNNSGLWLGKDAPLWMAMSWSLAVEEQFYLALPAISRNVSRKTLGIIAISIVLVSPLVRAHFAQRGSAELAWSFATVCRLDALSVGIVAAIAIRNPKGYAFIERQIHSLAVLASVGMLLMIAITCWPELVPHYLVFSVAAVFYSLVLLIALFRTNWFVSQMLRSDALRFFGRISYALYIVHQGVRGLVGVAFARFPFTNNAMRTAAATAAATAISILIAEVSWRLMEERLIRRAHRLHKY